VGRSLIQIFFAFAFLLAANGEPKIGETYAIDIVDLDGHSWSTADGRITILVLASSSESERAQKVGDNAPDYCLGNPHHRMITVLEFASHHSAPMRAIIRKLARRRIDSAARALQVRYDAKQIKRNAHDDVLVAMDFDGAIAARFGVSLGERTFAVFILNGKGELLQHWNDVPSTDALDAALRSAQ
jgi:hypothetical protein